MMRPVGDLSLDKGRFHLCPRLYLGPEMSELMEKLPPHLVLMSEPKAGLVIDSGPVHPMAQGWVWRR